jgi:hypothetical protein
MKQISVRPPPIRQFFNSKLLSNLDIVDDSKKLKRILRYLVLFSEKKLAHPTMYKKKRMLKN